MYPDDHLLTSKEVAEILRLKNHLTLSVWRSTNRYPLRYIKYGRMIRYRWGDVRTFLAQYAHTPNAPN